MNRYGWIAKSLLPMFFLFPKILPADQISDLAASIGSGDVTIVDLTHVYNENIPTIKLPPNFAQSMPFKLHNISRYGETGKNGPFWYWNWFWMGEHAGTHVDAPNHWVSGRKFASVDSIKLENLIAPAVVINVREKAAKNPDYTVTVQDIYNWENKHGKIPAGAMVIMDSGWWKLWPDEKKFLGIAPDGSSHNPGFSPEAARFLASKRDIVGIAADAVSTDALGVAGQTNPPFQVHIEMHRHGKYQIEMIANLDRIPPSGALLIIAPTPIEGGSGAPARILALTSK